MIAVGFYIGVTLKYEGALPFIIVAAITVLAMIVSEVTEFLTTMAVFPSRPSKDGFTRLDGHLRKNARLTLVHL